MLLTTLSVQPKLKNSSKTQNNLPISAGCFLCIIKGGKFPPFIFGDKKIHTNIVSAVSPAQAIRLTAVPKIKYGVLSFARLTIKRFT